MAYQDNEVRELIRQKVKELSMEPQGNFDLKNDDIIPETGYLDSAGIVEFIVWIEMQFGCSIKPSDVTIENLGSIDKIVDYLRRIKILG